VNYQIVVDNKKHFLDLYGEMLGSTKDKCMLCRSSLHYLATHGNLMDPIAEVDGHSPYLLEDQGYPLLPWLMVSHRK